MPSPVNIFWFRRDLRLRDNAGLYHALNAGLPVLPVFIFDTNILDELRDRKDARVTFIHQALEKLEKELQSYASSLYVGIGTPEKIFAGLWAQYTVNAIYTNNDYELYALQRDQNIAKAAQKKHIAFYGYKDQVIFEGQEVTKEDGGFYSIFTPYYRKWLATLRSFHLLSYPSEKYAAHLLPCHHKQPTLADIGFCPSEIVLPPFSIPAKTINDYDRNRDFPFLEHGTTKLGVHLRFGTVSIRQLADYAQRHNAVYLKELIWREFYQMILQCFPQIRENNAFKKEYDNIRWRNDETEFDRWKSGTTGIPIVDAGMRQLSAAGFMHNRVRMIVASFLTKNLLIDWRWGEAWFAEKLLDFDFASNNGGWQWAAGSGCDAAPYFRIFNPLAQAEKFDPEEKYVRKWVPEYGSDKYPQPIVDLKATRERCLQVYKQALQQK